MCPLNDTSGMAFAIAERPPSHADSLQAVDAKLYLELHKVRTLFPGLPSSHHPAMHLTFSLLSAFQFALLALCQSSGPDITPSGFPTGTLTSEPGSSTTPSGTATRPGTSSAQTSVIGNASTTATSTTTSAAFPSLGSYPACVSNCLNIGVAASNCSSVVEVNCFCTAPEFTQELFRCIVTDCPDELSASESLAQQFCNIASTTPTLTFPAFTPTTSTQPSSSSTSTTDTPTQSDGAGNSASSVLLGGGSWPMTALLVSALATTLSGFFLVA